MGIRTSHGSTSSFSLYLCLILILSSNGPCWAQLDSPPTARPAEETDAVMWGSGPTPFAMNEFFATADGCVTCHSGSRGALALRDVLGRDVSPWRMWRASAHANSARDPFFQAQAKLATAGLGSESEESELEARCTICHAPMVHHAARLRGHATPGWSAALAEPLGLDGVSCTICHAAAESGWEGDAFFDGNLPIDTERRLYGPYTSPVVRPMKEHSGYTATLGGHLRRSELCGSCHTQRSGPEQLLVSSSYLEWRATDPTRRRQCQQCHYHPQGDRRIARSPLGRDFNLSRRLGVGVHGPSGGNAYLLDLLRENADEFEVEAPLVDLERAAVATRLSLLDRTAELDVSEIRRSGSRLIFDVRIENRTGHKLPTGYPSRRVWLMVEVRVGGQEVFVTGRFDESGRLVGIDDPSRQPHRGTVRRPEEVPIFEAVPADAEGNPTTVVEQATQFVKDNRILPAGWMEASPDGRATAPIGVGADENYLAGTDVVHFDLDVLDGTRGKAAVVVRLFYQSVPPRWIEPHAAAESIASKRLVRITRKTPPMPEVLGMKVRFE